ncbi:hypothetical protein COCCADRAFT_99619 [Bipolaris zeicola 26-R-13]|uniref:Uncharacterized protein n=1 Tax=Cochliobolus carbonum (strain 26-R-13) TaxID=930089 RepID=W6Y393_COCC2|nr:uncharacterized protein COCCADRAFT_99619 [Bipolaris zeicola 26-R-13]EUC32100.1 hypothetical protein COCCADRAFT_99619 [Bipolaris zeicola 26-R-13]
MHVIWNSRAAAQVVPRQAWPYLSRRLLFLLLSRPAAFSSPAADQALWIDEYARTYGH